MEFTMSMISSNTGFTGSNYTECPRTGLVRSWQIIGNKRKRCSPAVMMSESTLWDRVRYGLFPQPVMRQPKMTMWNAEEIWDYATDPVGWLKRHNKM
jgi:predicted DNA-binding transcriptional regulator AlpA